MSRGRQIECASGVRTVLILGLALVSGCEREEPDRVAAPPAGDAIAGLPGEVHLAPGPRFGRTVTVENPYAGDARAVREGEELYTWYNCAGCHGALGGGGMGPPLRDADWIYGGDPASIYESIMEGRPEGMPSWQGKIPDDQAWRIVAFITALEEGYGEPALTPPEGRVPSEGDSPGEPPGGP